MNEESIIKIRYERVTVLAYGEGGDERVFLRHLASLYRRRDKVDVRSSSAGGSNPMHILEKALQYRSGAKRDFEFILLDRDLEWPEEMKQIAKKEGIELVGNTPCLEALFLDILDAKDSWRGTKTGRCKEIFERYCKSGNFDEEECERLFTKGVLNSARLRIPILDKIIKIMEGEIVPNRLS